VLQPVEERIRVEEDRGVLNRVRRRHALDGCDGDLRTSYVHSQDHAGVLSPGTRPCKLRGSGQATPERARGKLNTLVASWLPNVLSFGRGLHGGRPGVGGWRWWRVRRG